jgi:hypothetical protein
VQMGADSSDGDTQGCGDLVVGPFFLMIKHEDGPFHLA